MTDQELQELYSKRDELRNRRNTADEIYDKISKECDSEEAKLTAQIKQEELDRLMEEGKDQRVENVKEFFKNYRKERKVTDELWMVEVDGKKLCSTKGKYTWTSENRAFRGVCDYIYYNNNDIYHAVNQDEIDLDAVVEELIDEGYIKIIQLL